MKRVAWELLLYFVLILLLFALSSSFFFGLISQKQALRFYETELSSQAASIADTLNRQVSANRGKGGRHSYSLGMQLNSFLSFVDGIARREVWLVDREARLIRYGHGDEEMRVDELDAEALKLVERVFQGERVVGRQFSGQLGEVALTAGAPVLSPQGDVLLGIFLHQNISALRDSLHENLKGLLASLLGGLLLALLLSAWASRRLTRPLYQMAATADRIAAGELSARSGICRRDEIGGLSRHLDEMAASLEEARARDERREELQRAMVADISHELRTPVTVMRATLEAMRDGVLSDENARRQGVEVMLSESVALEEQIHSLMELALLRNGDYKLEMTELNLALILSDALRSQRQLAQREGVRLVAEIRPEPYFMEGNETRLRQLLVLLIHNAIKYSSPGGTVKIDAAFAADRLISVHNEGAAIAPEELPFLFDRYYRRKERGKEGSGLGLAIAREIARRHHLLISAQSGEGEGTSFILAEEEGSASG